MEQKQIKKLKLMAGAAVGLAALAMGVYKKRQKGEILYCLTVSLDGNLDKKEEIAAYIEGVLEENGWAFHVKVEQEKEIKDSLSTLVYYVLRADERELMQLAAMVKEKWSLSSVFYSKEEKPYRRL